MLCQRTRLSRTSFNCGRASGSLSLSRRRRRRRRLPCCPPHPLIRSPLSPGWISPDARRRPYSPLPPLLSAGAPPLRRTSPSPPVVAPEEGHHQDLSCVLPRSAKEATPSGPGLFAQRRRAFQAVRMASTGRKSGRGALVVLEGLDRSGKSSQCARLLSYLKGQGCCAEGWRFPDRGTSVGQMISAYLANESQLDDRTVHLLFSANRWEKRALMESKLLGGTTLIVDRYTYSGVAFSAAKGLDIEWCKAPDVGLIAPDLVIYLDVQPERAAERGGYGGERYEKIEFQKRVADHYHSLCDSTWKVVDGSLPMETVEEQLRELATNCIRECQEKPLTTLTW